VVVGVRIKKKEKVVNKKKIRERISVGGGVGGGGGGGINRKNCARVERYSSTENKDPSDTDGGWSGFSCLNVELIASHNTHFFSYCNYLFNTQINCTYMIKYMYYCQHFPTCFGVYCVIFRENFILYFGYRS